GPSCSGNAGGGPRPCTPTGRSVTARPSRPAGRTGSPTTTGAPGSRDRPRTPATSRSPAAGPRRPHMGAALPGSVRAGQRKRVESALDLDPAGLRLRRLRQAHGQDAVGQLGVDLRRVSVGRQARAVGELALTVAQRLALTLLADLPGDA